jgi:hypothetical protein
MPTKLVTSALSGTNSIVMRVNGGDTGQVFSLEMLRSKIKLTGDIDCEIQPVDPSLG